MLRFLYNTTVSFASLLFTIFSGFNPKYKKRKKGLNDQVIVASAKRRLWFHCASAGEYEQIASVIKALSQKFPSNPIYISFFSPSGVEWFHSKNIKYDHGYLPFDGSQKMKTFIEKVNPLCLVVAKNELWPNLIYEMHKKQLPMFFVSASIRPDYFALKFGFFKKHLSYLNGIFTQDHHSTSLLSPINKNIFTSGDTRISGIIEKANLLKSTLTIPFSIDQPTIIYGSLHKEDAGTLAAIEKFPHFNHIVVPHDISSKSINSFKKILGPQTQLSSKNQKIETNFVLIDEMGKLADLYSSSMYTYIGGGFGNGIHNIIEPLIHNNIVVIGPNHLSFNEATYLIEKGSIEAINKPIEFIDSLQKIVNLHEDEILDKITKAQKFISSHKNAASVVVEKISEFIKNED